jgi:hypothetical protein
MILEKQGKLHPCLKKLRITHKLADHAIRFA